MADVMIKDDDLNIDLEKVNIKEFGEFIKGKLLDQEDYPIIAKLIGQTVEYVEGLNPVEYKRIVRAIITKWKTEIDNPN